MTLVGPLAHGGAQRAGFVAGGAVGQEISQIEKATGPLPAIGKILSEPAELGRLHLRGDDPAHVAQHGVSPVVDAGRLLQGPVVHPNNDVLFVVTGRAHRHGPIALVQGHQGAGCIEADPSHVRCVDVSLCDGLTYRRRASAPRCRPTIAPRNRPAASTF